MENTNKLKIAVLGGGSFGTAIANMVAENNYSVTLWMRSEDSLKQIQPQVKIQIICPVTSLIHRLI